MVTFVVLSFVLIFSVIGAQDVSDTVQAVVGHFVELPCNVSAENDGDKLDILLWYRDDSATAFYSSRDLRSDEGGGDMSQGGRYRLVTQAEEGLSHLQILSVRPSDAGYYHCSAEFTSSPTQKTHTKLVVIEPPQRTWVIHENGTKIATASIGANASKTIGPYFVGETVNLFCVAFEGNPQATLSWWAEQRLLKNSSTPLSKQRVRSELMYGPLQREDHGRKLSCTASNNPYTPPLAIDIVLDMYLSVELISVRGLDSGASGKVHAGQSLKLQCRVLGARPPPQVVWRLGDSLMNNLEQNITMEHAQRLVVSEVQLAIDSSHDEGQVTCCAAEYTREGEQYACAHPLHITVLYPPVLQVTSDVDMENGTIAVVKGSNVTFNCTYQANPSVYQLLWYHQDDILPEDKESSEAIIQPILELRDVSEEESGEYACTATNDEGSTYSDPVVIDVTYPPFCKDEAIVEFGVSDKESVNLTCNVKSNPAPSSYRWAFINDSVHFSSLGNLKPFTVHTEDPILQYRRPNGTPFCTIFCWGENGVTSDSLPHTPCTFLLTDETAPWPPSNCTAVKYQKDITVVCEKGHDGGLAQKFKFTVNSLETDEQLLSIINLEPNFLIQEPKGAFKFVIVAYNDKGESKRVELEQGNILEESIVTEDPISAVTDITTLSLALCGGVALIALAACGLVLCAHDRGSRTDLPRPVSDPPLCAYNTEESNCETCQDSDGSECNIRRTESFRKAVSRYPSNNFDVRRSSSFHSARYMNDSPEDVMKCDVIRQSNNCRVHSLQNINRRREMDMLCDHLVMHLPPDNGYNVPKPPPMNTFYTIPRKIRHKTPKELSDEVSEITQMSDGFSLPPPPDEFGSYRSATRIKDIPTKSMPTYSTIKRKNSTGKDPRKGQYNVMSPMNTVGLPTISGGTNRTNLYSYPDDPQVNRNPFEDSS